MQQPGFEIIEHTADAGIVAYGAGLPELFANAALGMFSLMVDTSGVRQVESRDIRVEAPDLESLLVRWLTELLYYLDAEQLLFSRFEVTGLTETTLTARAHGEQIDPQRHDLGFAVKAVTRHMLEITRRNGGFGATILFDI